VKVYTLFIPRKTKATENQVINSRFKYPDPIQYRLKTGKQEKPKAQYIN
jgi:hypothetical protein